MNRVRVGLASLALALAACQGNQAVPSSSVPATVSPGTARATTAPEPSPVAASPAPTVAVGSFKPDSLVRVVTNDLRMRTEPGVHDGSIKLQPLLRAGTFAVVLDGPVAASGYDWFRIHPLDPRGALPEAGWVAAVGKDGERWIAAHSPDCPPPPVSLFEERLGEHPLACYGSREFTFSARLGGEETGPCFEMALAWGTVADELDFDTCARMLFLVDPATPLDDRAWESPSYHPVFAVELEPNLLHPEIYLPENWRLVSVTGQFDHPLARTCRSVANADPDFPAPKPDPAVVVLACRASFVVTELELMPA